MTRNPIDQTVNPALEAEERAILIAAQADPAAFAPLYERYVDRVYAYCLRRVGCPADAQDLTGAIFARALSKRGQYRGGLVAAWLFRIARGVVANHLRGRRDHLPLDADPALQVPDGRPGPGELYATTERLARVRAAIDALPEAQRELLLLKVAGGLTSREIGLVLGRSPGAVRVALHGILKRLRARLEQQGDLP